MDLISKNSWNQLKDQLMEKYENLTEADFEMAHGKADELLNLLHQKTGRSVEILEEELVEIESKFL